MTSATEHYQHAYPLDNDVEAKRLRNQHEVIKDASGGSLVLAPVDLSATPLRILDSGTADGTWVRDLASAQLVQHEIYGTDVNPAEFPAESPAGQTYQVQDITKPWPEDWKGKFDFVHQRLVLVAGGAKQKEVVEALCSLVKPGGWIQLIEATNELPDTCGPVMNDFVDVMNSVFKFIGADLKLTEQIPDWVKGAGFTNIEERLIPLKLGAQNPDPSLAARGVFSTASAAAGLSKFGKSLPAGTVSLPEESLDTLGSDLEQELKSHGAVYPLRAVWARKST